MEYLLPCTPPPPTPPGRPTRQLACTLGGGGAQIGRQLSVGAAQIVRGQAGCTPLQPSPAAAAECTAHHTDITHIRGGLYRPTPCESKPHGTPWYDALLPVYKFSVAQLSFHLPYDYNTGFSSNKQGTRVF